MKVTVQGKSVTLSQQDFVGGGGEGQVYAHGVIAYKIYANPSMMIPRGKIRELAAITDLAVVKPEDLVYSGDTPVGYTMRYIRGGLVLCQMFPRAFRERFGLIHSHMFNLVQKMRQTVEHIHKVQILLVDLNEMNFLIDSKFSEIFFIDADSYQTRNYPATAIMESVRDRHMRHHRDFNEGTDWFGFAITTFQLLTGIHPYKGKHPILKGLDERMKANISVFNHDVRVPASVYPVDIIPSIWRGWYENVFERGERCSPPGAVGTVVALISKAIDNKGDHISITKIFSFDTNVQNVWVLGLSFGILTEDEAWLDQRRLGAADGIVAFGQTLTRIVTVEHVPYSVPILRCEGKQVPFGMSSSKVIGFQGRIYLQSEGHIIEIVLIDVADTVMATPKIVVNILPQASMLFEGGVYQNALGSAYVHLFLGSGSTLQLRLSELDGWKVIEAKHDCCPDGSILMIIGAQGGKYARFVFWVDRSGAYDMQKVEDIVPTGLNFVVLDSGICVFLNEEEKLELFRVSRRSAAKKIVEDKILKGDMRLFKRDGEILFIRGADIYSMRMH